MSPSLSNSPEKRFADQELASAIETAIEALPAPYRVVFMLRDVEEMNTAETAECLDIPKNTVKTRLHRARTLVRQRLTRDVRAAVRNSFTFDLVRGDHLVEVVLARIKASTPPPAEHARPPRARAPRDCSP